MSAAELPGKTSTVAALATAPAPAGIAVIRVSGPDTKRALRALFKGRQSPVDEPRKLVFGNLLDHSSGAVIDHALAVYMPNPFSFTGEDVAEFQFHGSPLIVQKMLKSLFAYGVSPAEPGEFTRRAFENGKIDLLQAEAISDLINASSDKALNLASEQLAGKLSGIIDAVAEPLRDALAEIEAHIDFPEEDIKPDSLKAIESRVSKVRDQVAELVKTYDYGSAVKEGFRVLICGAPNAGKSSILNHLVRRERAIVTDIAGTTRDLIEEQVLIDGYSFLFCDSAGITETEDSIELIGIELARERLPWADLVLLVVDASSDSGSWESVLSQIKPKASKIWMVVNKIDLRPDAIGTLYCESKDCVQNFYLSVKTGDGFQALVNALVEEVGGRGRDEGGVSGVVTSERHRRCLEDASAGLDKAVEALAAGLPYEIISGELRIALASLEELVGRTWNEDLLGRIFAKFCIGK